MKLLLVLFTICTVSVGLVVYNSVSTTMKPNVIDTNIPITTEPTTAYSNFSEIMGGWESTSEGGSYYVFNSDNTFYWYKSSKDLNDNYYKGTLEALRGDDAISELGLSYDGVVKNMINSEGKITIDDIYALKLKPTYLISGGVDKTSTLSSNSEMKLLFVYIDENSAQAYNFNTGDTYYLQSK